MPTIVIPTFGGAVPRTTPRLLEPTQAQEAVNCNLERGAISPLAGPLKITDLPRAARTIFKHTTDGWLSWAGHVDVVKSAVLDVSGDSPLGHVFMTGDRDYPTQYFSGGTVYRLGVPRPSKAPVVAVAVGAAAANVECYAWGAETEAAIPGRYGSVSVSTFSPITEDNVDLEITGDVEIAGNVETAGDEDGENDDAPVTDSGISRSTSYCYTLVQIVGGGIYQQESAPSPPSEVIEVMDGDGVTISGFVIPGLEGLNITHIRIYRTVSGVESSEFHFLAEIPVGTKSWTDTVMDKDVSSEVLQTTTWDAIPDNARGLIKTDNGMYAAFRGNELLISEPFIAYAFPENYRLAVEDSIVALAHVDGTIIALTTGRPYLAAGSAPESLQLTHLPLEQSCVSARSIGYVPGGVVYAAPDGLMLFTSSDQSLLTAQTFTRDQWQEMNPSSLLGTVLDNKYVGFFEGGNRGFILSLGAKDVVDVVLPDGWKVTALYHHSEDDCVYIAAETPDGNAVYRFEAGEPMRWRWRSKPFFTSVLTGLSALRVEGDHAPGKAVTARVYGGKNQARPRATLRLTDTRTKRLPTTRSEKLWALELEGSTTVFEARMGGSVEGVEHGV